jgi:DNA polymerase III epsilon subunit-like protein
MTLVCGVDVETTGFDPATERITEAGAVLWDWETRTPLELMSRLVNPERPISAEITAASRPPRAHPEPLRVTA